MRTAFITDIHGYYEGLIAVMDDIAGCSCDRTLCLGDMVDGGGGDDAVVRYLHDRNIPTVFGNHDQYNDLELAPDVRAFITALPDTIVEGDALYTHVSPRAKQNKIADPCEAWNAFDETPARRIFVGHAHFAAIYGLRGVRVHNLPPHPLQRSLHARPRRPLPRYRPRRRLQPRSHRPSPLLHLRRRPPNHRTATDRFPLPSVLSRVKQNILLPNKKQGKQMLPLLNAPPMRTVVCSTPAGLSPSVFKNPTYGCRDRPRWFADT